MIKFYLLSFYEFKNLKWNKNTHTQKKKKIIKLGVYKYKQATFFREEVQILWL